MDRKELTNKVAALADEAKASGQLEAASILLSLAGALATCVERES